MTRRPLRPDELRVWVAVARTVEPGPGRVVPDLPEEPPDAPPQRPTQATAAHSSKPLVRRNALAPPQAIEPKRKRRLVRERDGIESRLDLHGLDQDRARAVLHAFLRRAWENGERAVLVITGKGTMGDGILRRRTPDWLSEPEVRPIIAGVSPADRRHGGEGAIYVALKRKG